MPKKKVFLSVVSATLHQSLFRGKYLVVAWPSFDGWGWNRNFGPWHEGFYFKRLSFLIRKSVLLSLGEKVKNAYMISKWSYLSMCCR